MENEVIAELNSIARNIYVTNDAELRRKEEEKLSLLVDHPDCLQRCFMLLENSETHYSTVMASNTLMKLIMTKQVMRQHKLELARYLLELLDNRVETLPSFCVTSLCQLFSRIIKQEYGSTIQGVEGYPFQESVQVILQSLSSDRTPSTRNLLALQILYLFIEDMSSPSGIEGNGKHRKNMATFRDSHLINIFGLSVEILRTLDIKNVFAMPENQIPQLTNEQEMFANAVLGLCHACLSYDFVGSLDESFDETSSVQIPSVWRDEFVKPPDEGIAALMWRLFRRLPPSCVLRVLKIIVQLAGVRRQLFTTSERRVLLEELFNGIDKCSRDQRLLTSEAFHEFSRIVARLKNTFQMAELVSDDRYENVIGAIAQFTCESFSMMDVCSNSTYFLLSFWQRMVASVPYVHNMKHLCDIYAPKVFEAFVRSRLDNVTKVVDDGSDELLDDQGMLIQILELLAVVCRCEYENTFSLLTKLFDENANILVGATNPNDRNVTIAEGKLAWLVTLIGTAIYGRTTVNVAVDIDTIDGVLMSRCLKLLFFLENRLASGGVPTKQGSSLSMNIRLEIAFIHLFEQFRRAYIIDQVNRNAVYDSMKMEIGIEGEGKLLEIIVDKLLNNMKFWSSQDIVLDLSLTLFKELCAGYAAVKKLQSNANVQLLLTNERSSHFGFLRPSSNARDLHFRTLFYEALTRILLADCYEDELPLLKKFLDPFYDQARQIRTAITMEEMKSQREDFEKQVVAVSAGLFRDLRGIAMSCTNQQSFSILLLLIDREVFPVMCDLFNHFQTRIEAELVISFFRLMCELCNNRSQRLRFEMNSSVSVILVQKVSGFLLFYSQIIPRDSSGKPIPLSIAEDNANLKLAYYKKYYKVFGMAFQCLKQLLVGQFVPNGVLAYFKDFSVLECLNVFQLIIQAMKVDDLLGYPKVAISYFNVLETIVLDNLWFFNRATSDDLDEIILAIRGAIVSTDATLVTSACSVLDGILTYVYRSVSTTAAGSDDMPNIPYIESINREGDKILIMAVQKNGSRLCEILVSIMSYIMFSDVKCQWSLSRPLLPLILMHGDAFENFKKEVLETQPVIVSHPDKKSKLDKLFGCLMANIELNVTMRNKDRFTHNLTTFRLDVHELLKNSTEVISEDLDLGHEMS